MSTSCLQEALHYAERSWPVLPVRRGDKKPATRHGVHDATTDPDRITDWFTRLTDPGVAIRTGAPSQLVVLDIDGTAGQRSLASLIEKYGPLPDTATVQTGGGGRHLFFRHAGGGIPSSAGRLADHIDVRAAGGYVVAPPSLHRSGRRYTWSLGPESGLAECPRWLIPPLRAARPCTRRLVAPGDDVLFAVSPLVYVPALTDRTVSRAGNAICPFHKNGNERTPSLHAYLDAEDGWYCYGCGAGGTIIDLAARLLDIRPRGEAYWHVRQHAARALLDKADASGLADGVRAQLALVAREDLTARGFVRVPKAISRGLPLGPRAVRLSPRARLLYLAILDYSYGGDSLCTASQHTLGRCVDTTARTVRTLLGELQAAEVIEVLSGRRGTTNTIRPLLVYERNPASGEPRKPTSAKEEQEKKNTTTPPSPRDRT